MKKPRYIQLSEILRNLILNDEYQYGEIFPPERELERIYLMDRKTIRKALNILVDEGLLTRVKGKGTFVNNPDINFSMKNVAGFRNLLEQQGVETTTKVISISSGQAGYRLAKIMKIGRSDVVWKMIRRRFTEEEPLTLEVTYVKENAIPDFNEVDFEVYSLYDVLVKSGHIPTYIDERIEAVEVAGTEAKYLGVEDGETVFLILDLTRDQNGEAVEYTKTYTKSSRIKLSTQLS